MVSPYNEEPGSLQDVGQKVVLRGELRSILARRVDGRVNVASQTLLCPRQRLHHVLERRVTNHEQIQITSRS
jgi:hypothetical protein